jgi:hypothetical protein
MRDFSLLDSTVSNEETGVFQIVTAGAASGAPRLALRREGGYVSIAVTSGPIEIALRPRFPELTRVLGRLRPVSGLQTTRQVGTGQAYIALGLRDDGALVVRPTIVADATGHLCFNLLVSPEARAALFAWLEVVPDDED